MTDEELKALFASNAQGISQLQQNIDRLRRFQEVEAREWRLQLAKQNADWRESMKASYDDLMQKFTQFAEEAARDRAAIHKMTEALFRHQQSSEDSELN